VGEKHVAFYAMFPNENIFFKATTLAIDFKPFRAIAHFWQHFKNEFATN